MSATVNFAVFELIILTGVGDFISIAFFHSGRDNFATIVKAISSGRSIYVNIKNSIKFLLSGNAAGIFSVIFASVAGLAAPFAPVHLLFINLLLNDF